MLNEMTAWLRNCNEQLGNVVLIIVERKDDA